MSALENAEFEKTRNILGALVLLTEGHPPNYISQPLIPDNEGIIFLKERGYVIRTTNIQPRYRLTDSGRDYARKTMETIGKIL